MKAIEEILDDNIDLVNELINAAFKEGHGTMEVGPAIASAISAYATRAIFARTATGSQMSKMGIMSKPSIDGESS